MRIFDWSDSHVATLSDLSAYYLGCAKRRPLDPTKIHVTPYTLLRDSIWISRTIRKPTSRVYGRIPAPGRAICSFRDTLPPTARTSLKYMSGLFQANAAWRLHRGGRSKSKIRDSGKSQTPAPRTRVLERGIFRDRTTDTDVYTVSVSSRNTPFCL